MNLIVKCYRFFFKVNYRTPLIKVVLRQEQVRITLMKGFDPL